MISHFDIIIVGSGIVGATAALALANNSSWQIAILDAKNIVSDFIADKYDHRVSALSLASKNIFQNLNVWEKMAEKRVSVYQKMHVWDAAGKGTIHFDCNDIAENALGYIVEDHVMRLSLYETLRKKNNVHFIFPVELNLLVEKNNQVELTTKDGRIFSANLLIAADGGHSWVREKTNIALKTHDYQHTAIVTTVKTEKPHEATAWQRFTATGPLAFLPLDNPHISSIVWSTMPEHAAELLNMDDTVFRQKLTEAFAHQLGEVLEIEQRYCFPLHMRHAKKYVLPRIALIGDAAHTLHPLAGQGVNLGLLDAVCLAEAVMDAFKKNRDFSSFATLRRYERWRKGDIVAMLAIVDFLKKLFISDVTTIKTLRNAGISFVNQAPLIKRFFVEYAVGKRDDLPTIC